MLRRQHRQHHAEEKMQSATPENSVFFQIRDLGLIRRITAERSRTVVMVEHAGSIEWRLYR
jgi:hypothetical protein